MSVDSTDRELLCLLDADPAAFEVFYRRHIDRVVRFATRRLREPADVADVVASTFVTVLTSARSYDPDRGEPTAWLLGIAARLIANRVRQAGRESALAARIAGRRLLDPNDIERLEDRIHADQQAVAVIDALDRLKPRARETLLLVGVDGLTAAEASRFLGISSANFRMRLSAARRALNKALYASNTSPHSGELSRSTPTLKEVTL
jgi:RNA polymerase sigma factor (sigma-70 family)